MAPSKNLKTYKAASVIDGLKSIALRTSGAASKSTTSSVPSYFFGPKSAALKKRTVAPVSQEHTTRSQTARVAKNGLADGTTVRPPPKFIVEVLVPHRWRPLPTVPLPSQATLTALSAHTLPPYLSPNSPQSHHLDESDVHLRPQPLPFCSKPPCSPGLTRPNLTTWTNLTSIRDLNLLPFCLRPPLSPGLTCQLALNLPCPTK